MLGYWDKKDTKKVSQKYTRSDVRERRANVKVVDSGKEVGKTTVVKKINDKSGFWTEKDNGERSSVRLKKENFASTSSEVPPSSLEINQLKKDVNDLVEEVKKLPHIICRLKALEEDNVYTKEILALITKALKVKVEESSEEVEEVEGTQEVEEVEETQEEQQVEETQEVEKVEETQEVEEVEGTQENQEVEGTQKPQQVGEVVEVQEDQKIEETPIYFSTTPLGIIRMKNPNDPIYPFGKRIVTKYNDEECSFTFNIGKEEFYAYGEFGKDSDSYCIVKINEFTNTDGKHISKNNLRFPIRLKFIDNSDSIVSEIEDSISQDDEKENNVPVHNIYELGDTVSEDSSDEVKSTEPTELDEQEEVEPIEPDEQEEVEPEPIEPDEQEEVEPEPIEQEESEEPTEPTEPDEPEVEPTEPDEPETPTEQEEPTEPEEEPDEPEEEPDEPEEEPDEPTEQEEPTEPTEPDEDPEPTEPDEELQAEETFRSLPKFNKLPPLKLNK